MPSGLGLSWRFCWRHYKAGPGCGGALCWIGHCPELSSSRKKAAPSSKSRSTIEFAIPATSRLGVARNLELGCGRSIRASGGRNHIAARVASCTRQQARADQIDRIRCRQRGRTRPGHPVLSANVVSGRAGLRFSKSCHRHIRKGRFVDLQGGAASERAGGGLEHNGIARCRAPSRAFVAPDRPTKGRTRPLRLKRRPPVPGWTRAVAALRKNEHAAAIALFDKILALPETEYSAEAQELLGWRSSEAARAARLKLPTAIIWLSIPTPRVRSACVSGWPGYLHPRARAARSSDRQASGGSGRERQRHAADHLDHFGERVAVLHPR